MPKTNWHALKLTEVFKELGAARQGLTVEEVKARQEKYGLNILPKDRRPSVFSIFARQMKSPLVYILLIAAFVTLFLREFIDMGIILAAVLVNSAIGFWQEMKADEAFVVLKKMIKHNARVMRAIPPHLASPSPTLTPTLSQGERGIERGRGGLSEGEGRVRAKPGDSPREMLVDASEVVPGDIIVLQAGDKIPADGRLIQVYDFEANEAALTGESAPVQKQTGALPFSAALAERTNMVFQGTTAAQGKALAVVVATGRETAFGEIALLVREVEEPVTPLQRELGRIAKFLGALVVIVTVGIFTVGLTQGRSPIEIFLIAVAVAVAAIPEGLIVSLTVILALGMRKLARERAIVKRLIAAETLGSVSVVCADKTGTLTTGEMEVTEIWTADNLKSGYTEIGSPSRRRSNLPPSIQKALEIAVVGNEASVGNPGADPGEWKIIGSPTLAALMQAGIRTGFKPLTLKKSFPEIDAIPFDSRRKWSATLHSCKESEKNILHVRGAPERVLEASRMYLKGKRASKMTLSQRYDFEAKLEEMTQRGMRVVAVAYGEMKKGSPPLKELKPDDALPGDLIFTGFFGIKDPLRQDTKETIERASEAGIRTIMITGDHAKTAVAIGQELGLVSSPSLLSGGEGSRRPGEGDSGVLTGSEMDALDDESFRKRAAKVSIFARVTPKHKVRIVDACHARGEAVAMTGDGVNDAPALKAADIGVAVGSGTDVAKEAADVVLTDNNLKTIVGAVEGGRNIYENVKKVVAYLLSDSWTEIIIVVGSLILGLPLPILAAQILWVNLIEDSLPNMALAFDPGEPQVMKDPPRPRAASIMDTEMKTLIFGVGVTTAFLLFGFYLFLLYRTDDLEYIRTMIFVGLGINSLFYIYSIRSLKRFIWQINPFSNKLLLASTAISMTLLVGAIYIPLLQTLLRTVSLAARDWAPLVGLGIINVILIEMVKWIFIHKGHRRIV